MPYKTFNNWLFDGSLDSPLPKSTDKVNLLKYNSPITHTFVLQLFLRNGPLNNYLNKYFNNIGLRYLDKEEFFKFIKKCVIDFRVNKRDIVFYPRRAQNKLFDILRGRFPLLKKDDVYLLIDEIDRSDEKGGVYNALGLEAPKKRKIKTGKKVKKGKITLKEFLEEHFSLYREMPSKN
jgi:hypothetical protein